MYMCIETLFITVDRNKLSNITHTSYYFITIDCQIMPEGTKKYLRIN